MGDPAAKSLQIRRKDGQSYKEKCRISMDAEGWSPDPVVAKYAHLTDKELHEMVQEKTQQRQNLLNHIGELRFDSRYLAQFNHDLGKVMESSLVKSVSDDNTRLQATVEAMKDETENLRENRALLTSRNKALMEDLNLAKQVSLSLKPNSKDANNRIQPQARICAPADPRRPETSESPVTSTLMGSTLPLNALHRDRKPARRSSMSNRTTSSLHEPPQIHFLRRNRKDPASLGSSDREAFAVSPEVELLDEVQRFAMENPPRTSTQQDYLGQTRRDAHSPSVWSYGRGYACDVCSIKGRFCIRWMREGAFRHALVVLPAHGVDSGVRAGSRPYCNLKS